MKILKNPRWDFFWLGLITLVLGVGGGPVEFHQDSILEPALHALVNDGNPEFLSYPGGVLIYPLAALYAVIYFVLLLLGIISNTSEYVNLLFSGNLLTWPVEIHTLWPATIFIGLFGVLGVLCVYAFTRDIFCKRSIAWIAGLFAATAFIWTSHSHYITVDVPLAALGLAAVYFTWRFTREGTPLRLGRLILIGILVGLTTSAKYNGALVLLGIGAVVFVHYKSNVWRAIRDNVLVGLTSFAVFLLTNPFLLIDFNRFRKEFAIQMVHAQVGHFGYSAANGWLHQIGVSLNYGVGALLLVLAGIGIIAIVVNRRFDMKTKVALLVFPLLFYLYMGQHRLGFYRYVLPLVPFIAMYAAAALHELHARITRFRKLRKVSIAAYVFMILLVLFPNLRHTWIHNRLLGTADTRVECAFALRDAGLWQMKPRIYSTPLMIAFAGHFGHEIEPFQKALNCDLSRDSIEMILFDSFVHDRLLYADLSVDTTMRFGLHDPNLEQPLTGYENMVVVQISPFVNDKADVPFSQESYYSPFLPDLHYRTQRGSFIEIYLRNHDFANAIAVACTTRGQRCSVTTGDRGYYIPRLSRYAGLNRGCEFTGFRHVNSYR